MQNSAPYVEFSFPVSLYLSLSELLSFFFEEIVASNHCEGVRSCVNTESGRMIGKFSEIRCNFLNFYPIIRHTTLQRPNADHFQDEMRNLIAISDDDEEIKMKWKTLIELHTEKVLRPARMFQFNFCELNANKEEDREREGEVPANFSLF